MPRPFFVGTAPHCGEVPVQRSCIPTGATPGVMACLCRPYAHLAASSPINRQQASGRIPAPCVRCARPSIASPHPPPPPPPLHLCRYITVDEAAGRALFYVLAQSASASPADDPLVLWLNG